MFLKRQKPNGIIKGMITQSFTMVILIKKRRQLTVKGVKVDGEWVIGPSCVQKDFFEQYDKKFKKIDVVLVIHRSSRFREFSMSSSLKLERSVTMKEVKQVVWECGSDKSLGPNGFNFAFVKKY